MFTHGCLIAPTSPGVSLWGTREQPYCEMMCFSDNQPPNEKAINRICLHSMGRIPSHLIRYISDLLLLNLRLNDGEAT